MLDPKEAPEGYVAVREDSIHCKDCAFYRANAGECLARLQAPCMSYERADQTTVIFRKLQEQQK